MFRLRCAAPLFALLLSGCLEDPPAYDPCSDENSEYFSVSPQGCHGHTLTSLWDARAEVTKTGALFSYRQIDLVFGNGGAYWTDWDGNIFHVDDSSSVPRRLFDAPAPQARLVTFDASVTRLYASVTDYGNSTQRPLSQIYGIDVTTGESRLLAHLADTFVSNLVVSGDRFYFTSSDGSVLLAGPLDWGKTSKTSDLQTCLTVSQVQTYGHTISGGTLYYLDTAQSLLSSFDLGTCSTMSVLPIELAPPEKAWSMVLASAGRLFLQECDQAAYECTLVRLTSDGVREPDTKVGGYLAAFKPPFVAGNELYLIAKPSGNSGNQPGRLFTWGDNPNSPIAIAAPLGDETRLAVNDRYVYALENGGSFAEGVFENADTEYVFTARLVRVSR